MKVKEKIKLKGVQMKLTKKKLKELYENNTNKDLCKMLNITNPTLVKYIKDAGIERKGMGNRSLKGKTKITIEG